ncbi:MAG: hypothetical protein KAJ19_17990, partial [Gammaproteobacteria bacterium]|nr:hypothetical protein [Gammaproteobacteria bacterium]
MSISDVVNGLGDKEASKAVLAGVLEETANALKALIDDVEIESGSNAEGLLANLSKSVVRAKKIIQAADDAAVELRYLTSATYDCKCDASVGMAP